MKVKEESEKVGLKLNIQKTKFMASGPITSQQIDGETTETMGDFIFLGSKITEDGDCSHEIKGHLLLGRKAMTSLDSILKGRDITLSSKVCLVKAMVFPVIMYGCESWTIKKAECWRIDAFEQWCCRRLLRIPWTARRPNQSFLKEISPEYYWKDWYWSWNSNTLATWCEELTHWKRPWCWERLRAGGEADDRGWDGWMASLTPWTWVLASSGSWWWEGNPSTLLQSIGSQRFGHDWVTELKTDWHTHTDQPPYHHQKGTTVIVFHGLSHLVEMYGVSTKNHAPTIVVSMANSYVSRTSWARYWVLFTYLIVLGCHRCSQGLLS